MCKKMFVVWFTCGWLALLLWRMYTDGVRPIGKDEEMAEQMILKIDGDTFRKLIVPAYVAYKADKFVYTHLLIAKHDNDIISYGTDFYTCYRVDIEMDKVKAEASEGFRVCLFANDLVKNVSKFIEKDSTVTIKYKLDDKVAYVNIENNKNDVPVFMVPVLIEDRGGYFQDEFLARLFTSVLEDSAASEKVFNFVLFDRMFKHIKTAVTSRIERKNLAILCTRSGDRHADIFAYDEWFAALIMPIKR